MNAAVPDPPAAPYPTRAGHAAAWERLAQAIAAAAPGIQEAPSTPAPVQPGELTIIGSGIESVGFVRGDEALIRAADTVFFCVADPATVVWLRTLRPDALDLYVLYDDRKPRYVTYMQMTEAMLHPVRAGQRVTAIFYGHPGIFVLATHRAVLIARREGHRAIMRPGISALDCLCADLGIDPAHPGLQTHEATDLLLRRRRPDPALHVVLWQVGLIGELGYRRAGYLNNHFMHLLDYLETHYGPDWPVTNYIAARYPTIPPVLDTAPLMAWRDPARQAQVTGISTFYLPPRDPAPVDEALLRAFGLLGPGRRSQVPASPLRAIGHYGPRERLAFADFARFRVPADYQWQPDTPAARFIIALRERPALQALYASDPQQALATAGIADLGAAEQRLLASRAAGSVQLAAKGLHPRHPGNQAWLGALFASLAPARALRLALADPDRAALPARVIALAAAAGHRIDWDRLRADCRRLAVDSPLPWAGVYAGADGTLLIIQAVGRRLAVRLDGEPIHAPGFRQGVLHWPAAGNPQPGHWRVDRGRDGRRRLHGQRTGSGPLITLTEGQPGAQHAAAWLGEWTGSGPQAGHRLEITVADGPDGRALVLRLDGADQGAPRVLGGRVLGAGARRFVLARIGAPDSGDWQPTADLPAALAGTYDLDGAGRLRLDPVGLRLDDAAPGQCRVARTGIDWSAGPPPAPAGNATALLDPITLWPCLSGWITPATGLRTPLTGRVPPPPGSRRTEADFGLPLPPFTRLVATATVEPFIWQRWRKARAAADLLYLRLWPRLP